MASKDPELLLHDFAAAGKADEVARLIEKGVNVNTTSDVLATPLHLACIGGHTEVGPTQYSHLGVGGWEAALLLLDAGADIKATDVNGFQPGHYAAAQGFHELLSALVEEFNCGECRIPIMPMMWHAAQLNPIGHSVR
jgi:ankyrin repeat protein